MTIDLIQFITKRIKKLKKEIRPLSLNDEETAFELSGRISELQNILNLIN